MCFEKIDESKFALILYKARNCDDRSLLVKNS